MGEPSSFNQRDIATRSRRAIIVGGGTGLGLASSLALAGAGWQVFITGRREDRLAQAQAIHPAGRCHFEAGDGTVAADVQRVVNTCVRTLGGIDALVISAGQSGVGSVLQADLAQLERIIQASVWPLFLYTQAAVPHMLAGGGSICAIASVTASVPQLERVAYCSAKAAVIGMVRQMALDLAPVRIRVNSVSPSLVPTELSMTAIGKSSDPQALLAARIRSHPIGRIGTAEEVGQAVAWLCSDQAGWVTGQDLVMDGGLSLTAAVPR